MTEQRPLYLVAAQSMDVTYRAPALTIAVHGCADALYPLARISRILSRGAVAWSGEALAGCLDHGVPVLLMADDGRLRGVLTPHRHPPADLSLHLASAPLAPEWPEHYRNWYLSQQRRIINRLAAALGWRLHDCRPGVVQRRLDLALHQHWQRPPQTLLGGPMVGLRATVAESLAQAGVDAGIATGAWGGMNLADDLARLAAWPLRGRLLASPVPPPGHPVEAFAHYQRHLAAPMAATVARLVRYLWQIAP